MELRQLQCFVECARTQSFSQAASLLFTTQSNVSKMISSLEDEFGQKLFVRKQRGIQLTEKGRQIYQYALSIIECSENLMECVSKEVPKELHVSFQPSNWFSIAFTDYFNENKDAGVHYFMKSATVDKIIRRLSNNLDQLGFAYIEEQQMHKLSDVLKKNHIDYTVLKRTKTVICYGAKTEARLQEGGKNKHGEDAIPDFQLIQGFEDEYSGMSFWRSQLSKSPQILITTDSDYIMKEVLSRTEISTICPDYPSHRERSIQQNTTSVSGNNENVMYICMFRNDSEMSEITKSFLEFIRTYINAM